MPQLANPQRAPTRVRRQGMVHRRAPKPRSPPPEDPSPAGAASVGEVGIRTYRPSSRSVGRSREGALTDEVTMDAVDWPRQKPIIHPPNAESALRRGPVIERGFNS